MIQVWAYFLPLLLGELLVLAAAWESFSERDEHFAYTISDIWALILGLTPSFLLAAHTARLVELQVISYWPPQHLYVLLAVLVFSQILGTAVAKFWYAGGVERGRYAGLKSGAAVAAGTVGGFVALVLYMLVLKVLGRPF
jgi:hypothetical protein